VLVSGARQTGKSTLVQSPELAGQGRHYLTFDDPSIMAAAMRDSSLSVSNRRQRTLFHQFLILQLGPEFSRNSRLRADALPADIAGDSDAGCGKFSPGST
jgi:hypothetical protein